MAPFIGVDAAELCRDDEVWLADRGARRVVAGWSPNEEKEQAMRRLLGMASVFVVVGLVLVAGQLFAAGTFVARVQAQDEVDVNGNACIDVDQETPAWLVPPVQVAGPPSELADPTGPPTDIGPSTWGFTLSEGELYRGGCGEDGELIAMIDGELELSIPDTADDPGVESFVTFVLDGPSDRCTTESTRPLDSDPNTCVLGPGARIPVVSGDVAYHPTGALYQYSASGTTQTGSPSAQTSPTDGVAAGGVRASGVPLVQSGGGLQSTSKGSKPLGCGGDCRP